jgi:hypothetical protein
VKYSADQCLTISQGIKLRYKPGDSQFVAREAAESIHGCRVHLLLSHFKRGFDDEIVDRLSQYGFALVNDQRFVGTRVASLSRCPGATP